jgi:hypothetical protein
MTRARIFAWLALAAAGLYVLPETVLGGDNAEFVSISAVGGVAHPPGYPLYALWLRLFSVLPLSPPKAAALATLVLFMGALVVLDRALRAWTVSPPMALAVTSLLGTSPLLFTLGTHAEVFAPLLLLAALVLLASAPEKPNLRLFAACMGLGFAHHHTLVFLAPLVFCAWQRDQVKQALVLGALCALLPYVWLFQQSHLDLDAAFVWRRLESFSDLKAHILRRDYGSTQLFGGTETAPPFAHLPELIEGVARGVLYLPLVLVPLAWRSEQRRHVNALAASWLLAGPLFFYLFNAPPSAFSRLFTERFIALPLWLIAPLIGLALDRVKLRFLAPGAAGAAAIQLFFTVQAAQQHHHDNVEALARSVLLSMPADAVLIQRGDHHVFSTGYLQKVQGLRPDVIAVGLDAYRYKASHYNTRTQTNAFSLGLRESLDVLQQTRPVFITATLAQTNAIPARPCAVAYALAPIALSVCDAQFYEALRLSPPIEAIHKEGWGAVVADDVAHALIDLAERWFDAGLPVIAEERVLDAAIVAPWILEDESY